MVEAKLGLVSHLSHNITSTNETIYCKTTFVVNKMRYLSNELTKSWVKLKFVKANNRLTKKKAVTIKDISETTTIEWINNEINSCHQIMISRADEESMCSGLSSI